MVRSVARFEDVAAHEELVSPLDGTPVTAAAQLTTAVGSMLTSQLHMLNNRIGLSPINEYHLACSLRDAFSGVEYRAVTSSPLGMGQS